MNDDPHAGQPMAAGGRPLKSASAAMVLLHGRGASAESILALSGVLDHPGFAFLAPRAADATWYPKSFLAPLASNEPFLSSALRALRGVLQTTAAAGIGAERTMLLGFSQGACLTLEFAARHARRYGAVIGLTGGLLGPRGRNLTFDGSFEGTPVLLGAGDPDPHVPWERVEETAIALRALDAEVTLKRYPGLGHTIHDEQIRLTRELMERVAAS